MKNTLTAAKGLGLAAPQVATLQRIFIIDKNLGQDQKTEKKEYHIFINPRISWKSSDKTFEYEGCLSIPGLEGKIWRSTQIRVNAYNSQGKKFSLQAKNLLARAIQHEYDHLEGILYIDYINNKKDLRKVEI